MPELFIELFGEEIPARMQARAAADLERLLSEALAGIHPNPIETFYGPRRIALSATVAADVAASRSTERGPRANAPEQALAGFLRKHGAVRDQLRVEGDFHVLDKSSHAVPAASLIGAAMPALLRRFPWPKSMRWGGASAFTWVRPLRRIVCLLDGRVVPFDLRDGGDDGHGLASSNLTEGHRFHAPGAFAVEGRDDWEQKLRDRFVVVRAEDRRAMIADGMARLAAEQGLTVADDPGLLDEVAGLVEWPVPLLGRIGAEFMDLPPEVMQVSMRVNQRYFALRNPDGSAAPFFGFAANIEADDGGEAVIAGNERVLRARFSDARHFWDLDRQKPLTSRIPALEGIAFQAKLGTQGQRARRLSDLSARIAVLIDADPVNSARAGLLAKADLVTGMVAEFPQLQGVMGRYYALDDHEPMELANAIADHYAPKGPADAIPPGAVSQAVALADKIDQLLSFFRIGEKPTGSGDPYALRRAALGVVRIVTEAGLRFNMRELLRSCASGGGDPNLASEVYDFLVERLRVMLRTEGRRHDVLAAIILKDRGDLADLVIRIDAVSAFLATPDGADLLAGYRRAANILRIEDQKDGLHAGEVDRDLLRAPEERELAAAVAHGGPLVLDRMKASETYDDAMRALAALRSPLDAFFERVTVNAPEPELRSNRLALLAKVRSVMDQVADFSKIEGSST